MVLRPLFLLSVLSLAGCESVTPMPYQHPQGIKPGPGLFSGKKGEFVLYQGDPFRQNNIE